MTRVPRVRHRCADAVRGPFRVRGARSSECPLKKADQISGQRIGQRIRRAKTKKLTTAAESSGDTVDALSSFEFAVNGFLALLDACSDFGRIVENDLSTISTSGNNLRN